MSEPFTVPRYAVDPAKVKAARKVAGYTREEAGMAIGVGYVTIANYEMGRVSPPAVRLAALARLYGVAIESMLREGA